MRLVPQSSHYSNWARRVDTRQVQVGQSVLEFNGSARLDEPRRDSHEHFELRFPVEESPVISLVIKSGTTRLFTPGVARAKGVVEMVFASAAPDVAIAKEEAKPKSPDRTSVSEASRLDKPAQKDKPHSEPERGTERQVYKFNVVGAWQERSIECEGEDVTVTGFMNEVKLMGKCKNLTITGTGNKVTAEEVGTITVTGTLNVVKYVRGPDGQPPTITGSMRSNEVEQIVSN